MQYINKKEFNKILKQVSSPTPTKQLEEENLENISNYKLVNIEKYTNIQIKN